ncbi:MAG: septal ring lytic transglycosylase RlpA family protein [Candidatus Binatia bacterium]
MRDGASPPLIDAASLSRVTPKSPRQEFGSVQVGTASWYGPNFHGRKTASGELFNQEALTAAHPVLPIGTRVRVTKLDTNQSVDVEINDRGPFVNGRIIDLSFAAARALNMLEEGTAKVRLEILFTPQESSFQDLSHTN